MALFLAWHFQLSARQEYTGLDSKSNHQFRKFYRPDSRKSSAAKDLSPYHLFL
jgi:hypothetical protein